MCFHFPQREEILAAVSARDPQGEKALRELENRQPAIALLHRESGVDRRCDSELATQLDCERPPGRLVTSMRSIPSSIWKGDRGVSSGIASLLSMHALSG